MLQHILSPLSVILKNILQIITYSTRLSIYTKNNWIWYRYIGKNCFLELYVREKLCNDVCSYVDSKTFKLSQFQGLNSFPNVMQVVLRNDST